MAKLDLNKFLAEMTQNQSPADKEFQALQPVVKKDEPNATEAQFKATTVQKDTSKEAHMSNATGMEDDVDKDKPLGESSTIDEARFDHREAGSQGVMHPDFAKHLKVGEHADFYDHKTGDKKYGKVVHNDGKSVSVHHEGSVKKFRVSASYPSLHESFEELVEQNLHEISKKVLASYIHGAREDRQSGKELAAHHNAKAAASKGESARAHKAVADAHSAVADKRKAGINKAVEKLLKK